MKMKKANSHFDFLFKNKNLLKSKCSNSHFDLTNNRYKIFAKSKCSQIWVETAVYIVIGLAIIGIVLAIATPAINNYKDKLIIEQTITALNSFNEKILEVRDEGSGNKRVVEFRVKKGYLTINSPEDKIIYSLEESGLEYSQLGKEVSQGDIKIKTEKKGSKYNINLVLSYDDVNITYSGESEKKTLNPASVPYKLFVENNGTIEDRINVDIEGA